MNVSVQRTPGSARILAADQVEQLLVALADHLDEQVVGAGGDHDVVDLVQGGDRVGDRLQLALDADPDHRLPARSRARAGR